MRILTLAIGFYAVAALDAYGQYSQLADSPPPPSAPQVGGRWVWVPSVAASGYESQPPPPLLSEWSDERDRRPPPPVAAVQPAPYELPPLPPRWPPQRAPNIEQRQPTSFESGVDSNRPAWSANVAAWNEAPPPPKQQNWQRPSPATFDDDRDWRRSAPPPPPQWASRPSLGGPLATRSPLHSAAAEQQAASSDFVAPLAVSPPQSALDYSSMTIGVGEPLYEAPKSAPRPLDD